MTDPRLPDFWRAEDAALWEVLAPLVMNSMLAGANGGAAILPPELQPLINWDLFNRSALEYLQEYRLSKVASITKTTRDAAIQAIDDWVRAGEPLPVLQARLAPLFGKTRADRIAITEVTRIFAKGNKELWRSTGVVSGEQWRTARDDRVCPICAPLDGQITRLDDQFSFDVGVIAESPQMQRLLGDKYTLADGLKKAGQMVKHLGSGVTEPPAHVRCRCWTSPFVSEELLQEQIGGILAGQFFARVQREGLPIGVIYA